MSVVLLRVHRADLACIVRKYARETEKNLGRVVSGTWLSNRILLFEEANALFARRFEVRDANDRQADI
jgi:hypothetical protein